MSDLVRLIAPIARRISNMICRGTVSRVNSATKMQSLQTRLLAGEIKDGVEHFEPFGFTSKPLPGAEAVAVFLDGDRSHGIVLMVADRRYRLTGLQDGEMAIYDAAGNKVHLHNNGTIEVVASVKVQITSPLVTMSGNLDVAGNIHSVGNITTDANVVAAGDISDHGTKSMAAMRIVFNGHDHPENPLPGPTDHPNQTM